MFKHTRHRRDLQTALLGILTQRLRRECVEVLVQGIDSSAALHQLHGAGNVAVGTGDDDTTLLGVEAKLLVGSKLGAGDADIGDVVGVKVVVVVLQNLGHGVHVDLVLGGGVDDGDGEKLGVRVVALEEGDIGNVRAAVDRKE